MKIGITGFVILVLGLWLFSFLLVSLSDNLPLWLLGQTVSAQVDESWVEKTGENRAGEQSFQYFIQYSFTTLDGDNLSGTSSVAVGEWLLLDAVGEIQVVYLPANPSVNKLSDARFIPLILCSYIPLIIIGLSLLLAGWSMLTKGFQRIGTAPWVAG